MALTLVTPPTEEPVTIAEVRAHLHLDSSAGEVAPTAPTVALAGDGAGNVDDGAHRYRVTFVTSDGETEGGAISDAVTVADKTSDGKVAVSAIPLGGSAVTSRKLYRTEADGSDYLLLDTIADNTTTTYTDNTADASLGAACPTTNTTEDPMLNALITVARLKVEELTSRALIDQTWDYRLDSFPAIIQPPLYPLDVTTPVASLKYLNTSGVLTTLTLTTDYTVDFYSEPGRVVPAYGKSWPSTQAVPNAVTLQFKAGYGGAGDVPQLIKQAILVLIGHWYENREPIISGTIVAEVPMMVAALLSPYMRVTL